MKRVRAKFCSVRAAQICIAFFWVDLNFSLDFSVMVGSRF